MKPLVTAAGYCLRPAERHELGYVLAIDPIGKTQAGLQIGIARYFPSYDRSWTM